MANSSLRDKLQYTLTSVDDVEAGINSKLTTPISDTTPLGGYGQIIRDLPSGGGSEEWEPKVAWPDMQSIYDADVAPEGYEKIGFALFQPTPGTFQSSFGSYSGVTIVPYIRTSDGYTGTVMGHTWDDSQDVIGPTGEKFKWAILYGVVDGDHNVGIFFTSVTSIIWLWLDNAEITRLTGSYQQHSIDCFECTENTEYTGGSSIITQITAWYQIRKLVLPKGLPSVVTVTNCPNLTEISCWDNFVKAPEGSNATMAQSLATYKGPIVFIPQATSLYNLSGLYLLSGNLVIPSNVTSISISLSFLPKVSSITIEGQGVTVSSSVLSNTGASLITFRGDVTFALGGNLTMNPYLKEIVFEGTVTLQTDFDFRWNTALTVEFYNNFIEQLVDNTGSNARSIQLMSGFYNDAISDETKAKYSAKNYTLIFSS